MKLDVNFFDLTVDGGSLTLLSIFIFLCTSDIYIRDWFALYAC